MFTIGPPAIISLSSRLSAPFPLNITCIGFIGLLNTISPSVHWCLLIRQPFELHLLI